MTSSLKDIDVAQTKMAGAIPLHRVGMSNIECPVVIQHADGSTVQALGRIDAFVSLDQPQKGIHMSRLYLMVEARLATSPLSPELLGDIAKEFIKTHAGISETAHVSVNFDLLLNRPALLSDNSGWRRYPVTLWATVNGKETYGADLTVSYSSTCPCSAALSRQLIQNKFLEAFADKANLQKDEIAQWLGKEEAIAGTPHGQRSEGRVQLELKSPLKSLAFLTQTIDALEGQLKTPLQTAVKRADEQEFARLNAANLMFAEDAARRMHHAVTGLNLFSGTAVEAVHLESLHPHDAVAKVASGTLINTAWR